MTISITQARKEAQQKPKLPFLLVKLGYVTYVLPHDEGIKLMQAMQFAEVYKRTYSEPVTILPIGSGSDTEIEISYLSHRDYELTKMANLMGMDVEELKKQERTPNDIPF